MVHAIGQVQRFHPDAKRVVALAGAISFNLAVLLLLLMPMQVPPPQAQSVVIPVIDVFRPIPKPEIPPPIHVPVTRPQPSTTHPQVARRVERPTPATDDVVIDPQGTLPATTPVEATTTDIAPVVVASGPVAGVRLEYLQAPAPVYPRDALRAGIEGTVLLQVLVDVDGRPLEVTIQHGSGDRQLDNAARRQVLEHWRFRPAMQGGRAVQAIGLVPIAFTLGR